jgi:hypothetical protein
VAQTAYSDTVVTSPAPHALVLHVPPNEAKPGEPIVLRAAVDAPYAEALSVSWRLLDDPTESWHDSAFERSSSGGWFAVIPASAPPGFAYYIRGRDHQGADVRHFASAEQPHIVRVVPPLQTQLEQAEQTRLASRRQEISLDVLGHNFGNRYGLRDNYLRGELVFSHRLWRSLDQISFGIGSIQGRTPTMSVPEAPVGSHGSRYGFAQVRWRVHPSVFLDTRIGLGVSHAGFGSNARGVLTLGKPWRSCVQVGGEYIADLGPSAWLRLQWDTAPPLLMGASVVRTDLPGAVLSRFGVYAAYDISYRLANRIAIRGQISYGPRDGAAHFGGGIGTAVAF